MNTPSTDPVEIRKFGIAALIFFGIVFCLALWRDKYILAWIAGPLSFLGLCISIAPVFLTPVYKAWVKGAMAFGKGVNAVFLIMAWYLVITPFAIGKRLLSGAPLPLKTDKDAQTYWVERKEPAQKREKYIKRY